MVHSGVCVSVCVCVGGGCKGQAERGQKMSKFGHASELRCVLNFRSFGFVQITVSCENTLCPHLMGRLFACPCLIRFDELPPSSFVAGVISAAYKNDVCVCSWTVHIVAISSLARIVAFCPIDYLSLTVLLWRLDWAGIIETHWHIQRRKVSCPTSSIASAETSAETSPKMLKLRLNY